MVDSEDMVYFMFSQDQKTLIQSMDAQLGKEAKMGSVIINGEQKIFTEMVKDPSHSRYSDAEIVAYGLKGNFKYTLPD